MFLGLLNTLRSLIDSPITRALNETRRMARSHRESGGAVGDSTHGRRQAASQLAPRRVVQVRPAAGDFVVPPDIDPVLFATTINNGTWANPTSSRQSGTADPVLEILAGGKLIVPKHRVERIGAGSIGQGQGILNRLVADVRLVDL